MGWDGWAAGGVAGHLCRPLTAVEMTNQLIESNSDATGENTAVMEEEEEGNERK